MTSTAASNLIQLRSKADRGTYSREALKAIFKDSPVAHCAYIHEGKGMEGPDGEERPRLLNLPMLTILKEYHTHGEEGDTDPEDGELVAYIHTYYGSRIVQAIKAGLESITISTSKVDGLVLSPQTRGHSVNYRSATIYGFHPTLLSNSPLGLAEKIRALDTVIDDVTGYARISYVGATSEKDARVTAVIRVRIEDASCKQRTGGEDGDIKPAEKAEDDEYAGGPESHEWSGVIPCWTQFGIPRGIGRHPQDVKDAMEARSLRGKKYAEDVALGGGRVDGR